MTDSLYKHYVAGRQVNFWAYFPAYYHALYGKNKRDSLSNAYEEIIAYVQSLPNKPKILDIGANSGLVTIPLALLGYDIVAVEPAKINIACLEKALAENDATVVRIVPAALGLREETRTLFVPQAQDNASFDPKIAVANMPDKNHLVAEQVACTTLDRLAQRFLTTSERVFIKIDVQGFEHEVLLGGKNFLSTVPACHILYETDASLPTLPDAANIPQFLTSLGFMQRPWPHKSDCLFVKE